MKENCVFGGARGDVLKPQIGYTATANIFGPSRVKKRECKSYAPKPRE